MEAVFGVTHLQAKECRGLRQQLERERQDPPLKPAEGAGPCRHCAVRLPDSRAVREQIPALLSSLSPICFGSQNTDGAPTSVLKEPTVQGKKGAEAGKVLVSASPQFSHCPWLPS